MNKSKCFAALFMAAVFGLSACAKDPTFVKAASSTMPAFETDFTVAAEKTVNAVVCIKSYTTRSRNQYGGQGIRPLRHVRFLFGPGQQQPRQQQKKSEPVQSGLGSGVIISEDGYIVTNNHVIDGADKLEVLFNDNSTYEAKIIGTDEDSDLALIKVDAKGLSPITFGDSEIVKIGEWVLCRRQSFRVQFHCDRRYRERKGAQSRPERKASGRSQHRIVYPDRRRAQSRKLGRSSL